MKKRTVKLSRFAMITHNRLDDGFVTKRDLTCKESRHILKALLGIVINESEDFDSKEEYTEYNKQLTKDANSWLKGEADDSVVMEYSYDCADDPIGIWNAFKIAEYLISREII